MKGIDLFVIEEVEDSLEDGETSTDTTNNNDKLKCSEIQDIVTIDQT